MGPTARLAQFAAQTPTEAVPPHIFHEAKRTLINVLAIALAASDDPSADAIEAWDGRDSAARTGAIGRVRASEA